MIFDITVTEKGGVGKSVVTALRAEYYILNGAKTMGVDTDPSNHGFASYDGLTASHLEICLPGTNRIIPRKFDELVSYTEDPDLDYLVVDTGTSNVMALLDYLRMNETFGLLNDLGHRVRIHSVIRGASDLKDTTEQFASLCATFPDAEKVVWLNPNLGPIQAENGREFEQMPIYERFAAQVHAIIKIPDLDQSTFGQDFTRLLTRRETFARALEPENAAWTVVQRHRLKRIWADLIAQMRAGNL